MTLTGDMLRYHKNQMVVELSLQPLASYYSVTFYPLNISKKFSFMLKYSNFVLEINIMVSYINACIKTGYN